MEDPFLRCALSPDFPVDFYALRQPEQHCCFPTFVSFALLSVSSPVRRASPSTDSERQDDIFTEHTAIIRRAVHC
jgi:hypothetical protein